MSEKDLFVGPIGKRVEPEGAAIQDEKGKSYAEEQESLHDFENGNELEVARATLLPEQWRGGIRIRHRQMGAAGRHSAMVALERWQTSSLLPSGSSKNTA